MIDSWTSEEMDGRAGGRAGGWMDAVETRSKCGNKEKVSSFQKRQMNSWHV